MDKEIRQSVDGTLYRAGSVAEKVDEENRTIELSFSSEQPVMRADFFSAPWEETLGHKRAEVDLERLIGAPVLYNHSRTRQDRIGVIEKASVKGKRGTATVRISTREDVEDVWHDIRTGVLTNVSVGYNINERKLTDKSDGTAPDKFRVTRWTPLEISLVDIPADHTVGIGRNENALSVRASYPDLPADGETYRVNDLNLMESTNVDKDKKEIPAEPAVEVRTEVRTETIDATPEQLTAARSEGAAVEAARRADIGGILSTHATRFTSEENEELRAATIDNAECDVAEARALILDKLGSNATTAATTDPRVEAGEDGGERFVAAAAQSLATRSQYMRGTEDKQIIADAGDFRGFGLIDMARYALDLKHERTLGLSRLELVARAFTSSDFPLILADSANKSMLKGFEEAPESWQVWCETGNLSDFKQASRVGLSSFDALEQVNEDGEYKYGKFEENGETIQLATYGKLFAISRQAIINDDLNAFTKIPNLMGRAASRVAGDLAYGVLTANPTMSDGTALFHANHNNLQSATAITAASVGLMKSAMAKQKDYSDSSVGSNIRPKYLLAPITLEDTANVLRTAEFDPAAANGSTPNPARNTFEVVTDARLDADSATAWYMAAGQQFDTVEVAFLDGVAAPTLESQDGWSKDGTEFKVRIDVAAAPLEWRTLQKNPGA